MPILYKKVLQFEKISYTYVRQCIYNIYPLKYLQMATTKKTNLRQAIRAYILKDTERADLENVIMERFNKYYRESEERKILVFERWFKNAFDSIEENFRDYYRKHAAEDGRAELLNLLVDDAYEYLSKRYRQRYNKFN